MIPGVTSGGFIRRMSRRESMGDSMPETENKESRHDLLLQNEAGGAIGRLRLAGHTIGGRGVMPPRPLRVYGRYAVVCVLRGRGKYEDANGVRRELRAGDTILVFPELAHRYGPPDGETWDEMYLTFDGPTFDLWRQVNLLDSARPVRRPAPDFHERLRAVIDDREAASPAGQLRQLCDFLSLLAELIAPSDDPADKTTEAAGIARARALLDVELGQETDWNRIAGAAGMSYETFRKRFQAEMGEPPARYRARRRIEAARELLRYSPQLTNRQAAEILGFTDEYHFSRRFTESVGVSPREFRRGSGVGALGRRPGSGKMQGKEGDNGTGDMNMMVRPVTKGEMAALWDLRGRVLRPGKAPEMWRFPEDESATTLHLGAFTPEEALIGILTLIENEGMQLRGMAVAPEAQGQGVGAALLKSAHAAAAERGFPSLWCNARAVAAGFYARAGWNVEGDSFDVPGIGPHYVMQKQLL